MHYRLINTLNGEIISVPARHPEGAAHALRHFLNARLADEGRTDLVCAEHHLPEVLSDVTRERIESQEALLSGLFEAFRGHPLTLEQTQLLDEAGRVLQLT